MQIKKFTKKNYVKTIQYNDSESDRYHSARPLFLKMFIVKSSVFNVVKKFHVKK